MLWPRSAPRKTPGSCRAASASCLDIAVPDVPRRQAAAAVPHIPHAPPPAPAALAGSAAAAGAGAPVPLPAAAAAAEPAVAVRPCVGILPRAAARWLPAAGAGAAARRAACSALPAAVRGARRVTVPGTAVSGVAARGAGAKVQAPQRLVLCGVLLLLSFTAKMPGRGARGGGGAAQAQ
jgi:hypothetical protein